MKKNIFKVGIVFACFIGCGGEKSNDISSQPSTQNENTQEASDVESQILALTSQLDEVQNNEEGLSIIEQIQEYLSESADQINEFSQNFPSDYSNIQDTLVQSLEDFREKFEGNISSSEQSGTNAEILIGSIIDFIQNIDAQLDETPQSDESSIGSDSNETDINDENSNNSNDEINDESNNDNEPIDQGPSVGSSSEG